MPTTGRTPDEIVKEIATSAAKLAAFRAFIASTKKTAGMEGIGGLTWRQLAPVVGQGAALGTVAGGVTGAMAGGEGHRAEGALRGAAGGALLGGLGSAGMVGLRSHIGKSTADEYWALQGMAGKPEFPAAEEAFWKRFERNDKMLGMGELGGPVATGAIGGGIGGALARPGTPEQPKTASIGSVFGRALGGAAAGGLLGGGAGALAAHMRGGDVRQSAMTGALGGAGLGAGLGALSTGVKPGDLEQLRHRQFGTASTALLGGAGALFGKKLVGSLVGGEDSEAAEARQKELGRFEAMQQIKVKQLALLEPMHAAAFEHAQQDEIISRADPALVHSSFETMKRFAPNIAADPNAVKSFLRESASWGAGPSYATLKNLADAERAVAGAGGAV